MLSFGQRLKTLRQQASFSQSYLAENIGVSIQTISNWECDNTMPDISQIVPLANILGVSTDYLLCTGSYEETDKQQLDLQVSQIWSTYSVNTFENNADYMVYELYKDFLRKYPLNYEIKYKCGLALHDYLLVSHVRHKFEITEKDFDKLYSECEKPNKTTVIQAWEDMVVASKMFIVLFADPSDLTVNSYEKNPYCYLITAYTSMSNSYLKFADLDNALNCMENATNTAIELYKWGTDNCLDRLVLEDIVYFVKNTPRWCFSFSKLYSNDVNPFSNNPRYKQCITRILELINKD